MTSRQTDWYRVAEQLSKETDTEKMIELAQELNRLLGEREESSRRPLHQGDSPKSFRASASQ